MSKDAFKPVQYTKGEDGPPNYAMPSTPRENERGYVLTAFRMPYYDNILEFVQVDFPDGTSAYFRLSEDEVVAGPFGGGYSWACPKYVVKAAGDLLREVFQTETEEAETVDA